MEPRIKYQPYLNQRGFTLTELLVAAVIMGLVILGASRLFVTAHDSFAGQNLKTEMHQNAAFALRHMTETLEEAGADLPLRMLCVEVHAADSVTVVVNPGPGAAALLLNSDIDAVNNCITVPDARPFMPYEKLAFLPPGFAVYMEKWVDIANMTPPFVEGIDTVNHRISLGDVSGITDSTFVFVAEPHTFFLDGTNLCRSDSAYVLAENIDSMAVCILDSAMAEVDWFDRRFFRVSVTASTGRTGKFADEVTLTRTGAFKNF